MGATVIASGSALSRRGRAARGAIAMLAAVSLGVLTACSAPAKPDVVPSDTGADPAVTVYVIDNRYEPQVVEIEAGDAVRWVFEGPSEHDVVAADASFVSELTTSGEYTRVFEEAGEWAYDCSIHPEMTGTVIVR